MRHNDWNGDFATSQLQPVCCNFFTFAYNVSKQKIFYKKVGIRGNIMSDARRERKYHERRSDVFNSVHTWLTDFANYFLLSPTNNEIFLPFRRKFQVLEFYRREVEEHEGKVWLDLKKRIMKNSVSF